ncbi:hypothetical protein JB92DRAFT_3050618 [Gautieria morchelliformis]|nr:hypothetical protein JB92DRAFT_3050618 [Gautieria morchelliformis]
MQGACCWRTRRGPRGGALCCWGACESGSFFALACSARLVVCFPRFVVYFPAASPAFCDVRGVLRSPDCSGPCAAFRVPLSMPPLLISHNPPLVCALHHCVLSILCAFHACVHSILVWFPCCGLCAFTPPTLSVAWDVFFGARLAASRVPCTLAVRHPHSAVRISPLLILTPHTYTLAPTDTALPPSQHRPLDPLRHRVRRDMRPAISVGGRGRGGR